MNSKPVKLKKCAVCKERFRPFSSMAKVCSVPCAIVIGKKEAEKNAEKKQKKAEKEFSENDKTKQKALAQKTFNLYIRERDADLGCVSCDKPGDWGGIWHAGHFKSVGAHAGERFNELNVHKQCSQCNLFKSGNLASYRRELVKRIGIDEVEKLETATDKKNYRLEDYKEITKTYRQKIKALRLARKGG